MSDFNKIITNKSVTLSQSEVDNLAATLSPVIAACSEPVVYVGDGTYIEVNQSQQTIRFLKGDELVGKADTTAMNAALADKVDTSDLSNYLTTAQYETESAAFVLKTELPTVPTKVADLSDSANYYTKEQTSGAAALSTEFVKYAKTSDLMTYDVTAQTGISVTTAIENGVTTFGISMTAEPVITDTTISGNNGVSAVLDATTTNQWNVGLTKDITDTIDAKLDAATYQTDSATFLTAHQSLTGYYTKDQTSAADDIANALLAKQDVSAMTAYLQIADYETDKNSFVTSSTTTITGDGQFALTVDGWSEITGASVETAYLPLSGGIVSGEVAISGDAFDNSYLKLNNAAGTVARIGIDVNTAGFQVNDGEHTAQIGIAPTTANYSLITVRNETDVIGQLIPAVTATTTAGLTDDGILHIILDNA